MSHVRNCCVRAMGDGQDNKWKKTTTFRQQMSGKPFQFVQCIEGNTANMFTYQLHTKKTKNCVCNMSPAGTKNYPQNMTMMSKTLNENTTQYSRVIMWLGERYAVIFILIKADLSKKSDMTSMSLRLCFLFYPHHRSRWDFSRKTVVCCMLVTVHLPF